MVYFTCGACGESMKKGAVEKHYTQRCKQCNVLTCIDCLKDFHGEEYKSHNQCMSENQRYSKEGRSGWDPSQGQGNKGEQKQQAWIENLKSLLEETQLEPDVKNIVNTIINHENIPRKKPKFVNFIKNIMRNKASVTSIDKTWELFSQAQKPAVEACDKPSNSTKDSKVEADSSIECEDDQKKNKKDEVIENSVPCVEKKMKKKKKKDKKKNSVSSEDVEISVEEEVTSKEEKKKRSKKDKKNKKEGGEKNKENVQQNCNDMDTTENETIDKKIQETKQKKVEEKSNPDDVPIKKSKKRKRDDNPVVEILEEQPDSKKSKFNWDEVISDLLEKQQDNEMSLKKLKKKCIAEFFAQNAETHKTKEDLSVKLNKKLKKRKYKVLKDRVKLVQDSGDEKKESGAEDANNAPTLDLNLQQETEKLSFNKWEAASFGSSSQTDKFRRLMGIKSAPAPENVNNGNKRDDKKMFRDLEDSFEKARQIRQGGRGMGLGFAA